MGWTKFVNQVAEHLEKGSIEGATGTMPFDDEHALTEVMALSLRKLLASSFPDTAAEDMPYRVVYRDGRTQEDRKAWNIIQPYKWIRVHGLDFVPDVLVFRKRVESPSEEVPPSDVLPIEVKLVKDGSCSNELARGVGQCLVYNTRYEGSILFVGVNPGAYGEGERGLQPIVKAAVAEKKFQEMLRQQRVQLIFRDVGCADRVATQPTMRNIANADHSNGES